MSETINKMLEFKSEGGYTTLLSNGTRLQIYFTPNPTTVPSRADLNYLIGKTVLIDGIERVVYGVDSFALGGEYGAGRPIGLAVKESI